MTTSWTADDLAVLATLGELEIAARRADGRAGAWTPIWVVVVAEEVLVRTWQRRATGWYGRAVAAGHAMIRLGEQGMKVTVTLVGDADADAVDEAYRHKYGAAGAASMVSEEPRLSTLRLDPH